MLEAAQRCIRYSENPLEDKDQLRLFMSFQPIMTNKTFCKLRRDRIPLDAEFVSNLETIVDVLIRLMKEEREVPDSDLEVHAKPHVIQLHEMNPLRLLAEPDEWKQRLLHMPAMRSGSLQLVRESFACCVDRELLEQIYRKLLMMVRTTIPLLTRDHMLDFAEKVHRLHDKGGAIAIRSFTGSGKTIVLPSTLLNESNKEIVVAGPTTIQSLSSFNNLCRVFQCDFKSGTRRIVDNNRDPKTSHLLFVTHGFLLKQDISGSYGDTIFLDECHEATTTMRLIKTFLHLDNTVLRGQKVIIAASATIDGSTISPLEPLETLAGPSSNSNFVVHHFGHEAHMYFVRDMWEKFKSLMERIDNLVVKNKIDVVCNKDVYLRAKRATVNVLHKSGSATSNRKRLDDDPQQQKWDQLIDPTNKDGLFGELKRLCSSTFLPDINAHVKRSFKLLRSCYELTWCDGLNRLADPRFGSLERCRLFSQFLERQNLFFDPYHAVQPIVKGLANLPKDTHVHLAIDMLKGVETGCCGTVMIFVDGLRSINFYRSVAESILSKLSEDGTPMLVEIIGLYSKTSNRIIKKVTCEPEDDEAKLRLIIATNVAETSITISNLICVVDNGRGKMRRYNIKDDAWEWIAKNGISEYSIQQRRSRVGRVCEGIYIQSHTVNLSLSNQDDVNYLDVGLAFASYRNIRKSVFITQKLLVDTYGAIDPMEMESAYKRLQRMCIIDRSLPESGGQLTLFGQLCATLPLPANLAAFVVVGAILCCGRQCAAVVSAWIVSEGKGTIRETDLSSVKSCLLQMSFFTICGPKWRLHCYNAFLNASQINMSGEMMDSIEKKLVFSMPKKLEINRHNGNLGLVLLALAATTTSICTVKEDMPLHQVQRYVEGRRDNVQLRDDFLPSGTATTKPTVVASFETTTMRDKSLQHSKGKSKRFVKGQFNGYQESTIGAAFLTQTVCLDDATVKFETWDTAGQERCHSLAHMYYRGAQAPIVVYNINNQESFPKAKNWVKELQRQASPNIVMALASNKAYMANKKTVEYEEARAYAEDNALLFMETSAKTDEC